MEGPIPCCGCHRNSFSAFAFVVQPAGIQLVAAWMDSRCSAITAVFRYGSRRHITGHCCIRLASRHGRRMHGWLCEMATPPQPRFGNIAIATRFYCGRDKGTEDGLAALERLAGFVGDAAALQPAVVLVAIDVDRDRSGALEFVRALATTHCQVRAFAVCSGGAVTPMLNRLLEEAGRCIDIALPSPLTTAVSPRASGHPPKYILFASVEVHTTEATVAPLLACLEDDPAVFCAGAALTGHHAAPPEPQLAGAACGGAADVMHNLTGTTSPWNTLAMWRREMLALTGFLAISNQGSPPGMEEPAVIAVQQSLFGGPARRKALLLHLGLPDSEAAVPVWTAPQSVERRAAHARKMESKDTRTRLQLERLGLTGVVHHRWHQS